MLVAVSTCVSIPSQISLLKKYGGKRGILGFPISNNVYYGLVPSDFERLSSGQYITHQQTVASAIPAKYVTIINHPTFELYQFGVDTHLPPTVGFPKNRKFVYPKSGQPTINIDHHQYIDSSIEFVGPDPFYLDGPGVYTNLGGGDLSGVQAGTLELTKDSSSHDYISTKYPPY